MIMKRKELKEKVLNAVSEIKGDVKDFFKFAVRLPQNYSAQNLILIFHQKPNATYVQGFSGWKHKERKVKKGEKGISIFAPIIVKQEVEKEDPETGNTAKEAIEKLRGFKVTHVWDVSQTEGKELPEDEVIFIPTGRDPAEFLDTLIKQFTLKVVNTTGKAFVQNNTIGVPINATVDKKLFYLLGSAASIIAREVGVKKKIIPFVQWSIPFVIMQKNGVEVSPFEDWFTKKIESLNSEDTLLGMRKTFQIVPKVEQKFRLSA